jgi:hypothetical protein
VLEKNGEYYFEGKAILEILKKLRCTSAYLKIKVETIFRKLLLLNL